MPEAISLFVWRIGDGRTTRFLEDNWLGVIPLSCWPTFINMNTHWSDNVAECLLPDGNWNWDVINAWADGELQDHITHLSRALRSSHDVLLLSLTEKPRAASGQIYSSIVCNAWKGGNGSRSLEEFRGIWKLKVTPRVRVFMWRVAGDHLCRRCGWPAESLATLHLASRAARKTSPCNTSFGAAREPKRFGLTALFGQR
ncbi:hypothetical protein HPP92_027261 [Vanilla planifolia]|uniref:Reverse transcriptase zinc-binding domain-containing protein n=1 Tax=Vanilla planifolia TaxID=51239 RepID=A0A835U509_VANPL|nr:hypothetical protein HPP92_027261 [Vanilla planifolia]